VEEEVRERERKSFGERRRRISLAISSGALNASKNDILIY